MQISYNLLFIYRMKVLLQYNTSSKIREVSDGNEIFSAIASTFKIEKDNYTLQKYDEDFQEYVDLEDISLIEDKSKIKVILTPHVISTADSVLNSIDDIVEESHIDITDVFLNLKEQWHAVVKLPFKDFSRPLFEALEKKENLNWSLSSELVGHLATFAYSFKCYPNKQERLQICEALIQKYPHLKSDIGTGTGGWAIKLLNKLKKMRQSDNSLEVKLNREKRKLNSSMMPKKIKLNPKKGEVNWSPDHIEGETESSQKIHKQIMQEESQKALASQDKSKLRYLMALTYSYRRSTINNKVPISILLEQYPIFFQEEEQFEEFNRLTFVNIKETYFKQVISKGLVLFEIFSGKKCHKLKREQEEALAILSSVSKEDIESMNYIKAQLGLLYLPLLLKESQQYFVEIVSILTFN